MHENLKIFLKSKRKKVVTSAVFHCEGLDITYSAWAPQPGMHPERTRAQIGNGLILQQNGTEFRTQNMEKDSIPGSVEIEKWQLRHQNSQTEEDAQSPDVFATPLLVVVSWVHHRYVSETDSFNFRLSNKQKITFCLIRSVT